VPPAKIQLKGQFAIRRDASMSLSLQVARQLQAAIEAGRVSAGTQLPSTRSLARTLGVSRNTVLAAYDELTARGFVRSRRGAGMYVSAPVSDFDLTCVLRDAHYPSRTVVMQTRTGMLFLSPTE
jgi:GntR family transcriptional regulator/MocR family aminotransferase